MKRIFLLFTLVIVTLFACSKDEKEPTTISATNFTETIAENIIQGHSIGKVTASTNDATAITYSISSQSPEGSVAISTTGELTVKDASIFDYEKNQQVTGKVKLTAGETEKTVDFVITITDDPNDDSDDAIYNSLSDSRSAYSSANDGNWVEITKAEYENLFSNLEQTTKIGVKDEYYPNEKNGYTVGAGTNNRTMVLTSATKTTKIPANSYVIAFKYYPKIETVTSPPVVKTNEGSDVTKGYSDLGNTLPSHTGNKHSYFTIKGNTTQNVSGGYLAVYSGYTGFGFVDRSYDMYYKYGNRSSVETLDGFSGNVYQGIATTKKQW